MSRYLLQVAYTPEAWAAQLKNPQDRTKVLQPVMDRLGGSFVETYFTFGEYDVVAIVDLPSNVDAAALSLTATAGGALRSIKTTPLMTIDEGIQAMRKAGELSSLFVPATRQATSV
jgi:uncharacterized protein with GYD domain